MAAALFLAFALAFFFFGVALSIGASASLGSGAIPPPEDFWIVMTYKGHSMHPFAQRDKGFGEDVGSLTNRRTNKEVEMRGMETFM